MNHTFLAGLLVGLVLGVLGVFLALLALAWREEMAILRAMKGEMDEDE